MIYINNNKFRLSNIYVRYHWDKKFYDLDESRIFKSILKNNIKKEKDTQCSPCSPTVVSIIMMATDGHIITTTASQRAWHQWIQLGTVLSPFFVLAPKWLHNYEKLWSLHGIHHHLHRDRPLIRRSRSKGGGSSGPETRPKRVPHQSGLSRWTHQHVSALPARVDG